MMRHCAFLLFSLSLFAATIEEKQTELASQSIVAKGAPVQQANHKLKTLKTQLHAAYEKVRSYAESDADESEYKRLLSTVNGLKQQLSIAEEIWKKGQKASGDEYGLFDQEETTISQLVMEYGAPDHLYIIPNEVGSIKVHMHSEVPIPRESWSELIEVILSQNGVGVKDVNPFARQLYLMRQDLISVDAIVARTEDLALFPKQKRIVYVHNCDPERSKAVAQFFERFKDTKSCTVYQVGTKVALIATVKEIQKLVTLYKTVWNESDRKVSKVFPLKKIPAKEMERILKAFFEDAKKRITLTRGLTEELTIMTLQGESTLAVVGPKDMVARAEEIVAQTEEQISDPSQKTIYWYTCRHSDPVEVSAMLEKVYLSLIGLPNDGKETSPSKAKLERDKAEENTSYPIYGTPAAPPVVNPPVITPATAETQKVNSLSTNFVPYPQTGAIMMVVRKDLLEKIKGLVKKLDVPKKMVQIEVLLVEKTVTNQNNFGLNLLRFGTNSSHTRNTSLDYDHDTKNGILEFILKRPNVSGFPSFDLTYNFLMSQDDVHINASPSFLTLNQTPGQFSNVEEVSINSGAAPIESGNGTAFQNAFVRAQFGINIVVTPTIHDTEIVEGIPKRYVSLETNIGFDTTKSNKDFKPDVNRRAIVNNVRVLDGETVVIGGLQRKTSEDNADKIPFFGEIPGVGKFFSTTKMSDKTTEMFIFITPKVIDDDEEKLRSLRQKELMKRPGDLPEFLEKVEAAKSERKAQAFENSVKLLFGR